jgi:hypothetical protein
MSFVGIVDERIKQAIHGLRMSVQFVTGLVFTDDGTATCKGIADDDLEPTVGWNFGFYSRPKDGARGVIVKADGKGNTAILFAYRDRQYELSLEKGECGMKNAFDAKILLDKDGKVVLLSASGKTVTINGDTYFLPQWDPFATVLNAFASSLAGISTPSSLPEVITAIGVIKTAGATLQAAMNGNSNYKSTKAKNG